MKEENPQRPDSPDVIVADVLRASRSVGPAALGDLVRAQAARLGVADIQLWLADLQQRTLVPYVSSGEVDTGLAVDATLAGLTYREGQPHHGETGNGVIVWVPLIDGADRVGVLGGRLQEWDPAIEDALGVLASALAAIIATHSTYSDVVIQARRTRPASVPAEMQWALLPPLSARGAHATIGGVLEPAYDIGGDSFDYAINGTTAHLAVFDAMGHGLGAAVMASVAVGALRHARRAGKDLEATYNIIDTTISTQFGPDRFVTGVLAELNLETGQLSYIIAGHHPAVVLRGGKIVRHLGAAHRLPLGLGQGIGPLPAGLGPGGGQASESLEPGDRVLLYTDGVIEARDPNGAFFGLERLEDFLVREDASGAKVPETMRRLAAAVLEHQVGDLQDDATLLMIEWHPNPDSE